MGRGVLHQASDEDDACTVAGAEIVRSVNSVVHTLFVEIADEGEASRWRGRVRGS